MRRLASASTSFRVAADSSLAFAAFDITAHGEVPFAPAKGKTLDFATCVWSAVTKAPSTIWCSDRAIWKRAR